MSNSESSSASSDQQNDAKERVARLELPIMIYDMLEDLRDDKLKSQIVSWMPHGKAFRVHQPEKFETHVMPDYFQHERYGSFRHLLEQWHFLKLSRGKDRGALYNKHFVRGHRSKLVDITKEQMEQDMPAYLSPREEPNFYLDYRPEEKETSLERLSPKHTDDKKSGVDDNENKKSATESLGSTVGSSSNKRKATTPTKRTDAVHTEDEDTIPSVGGSNSSTSISSNKRKLSTPTRISTEDEKDHTIVSTPTTTSSSNKRKSSTPKKITTSPPTGALMTTTTTQAVNKTPEQKRPKLSFEEIKKQATERKMAYVTVASPATATTNAIVSASAGATAAGTKSPEEKTARYDFAIMLYDMLEEISHDKDLSKICSWQPHGKTFKVHRPDEFESSILPKYFVERYASFRFLLGRWGFVRLTRGKDRGAYYNINFYQNRPRQTLKGAGQEDMTKDMPELLSPREEPNFYLDGEETTGTKDEPHKRKAPQPSTSAASSTSNGLGSRVTSEDNNTEEGRSEIDQAAKKLKKDDDSRQDDVKSKSSTIDDAVKLGISQIPHHNLMIQNETAASSVAFPSNKPAININASIIVYFPHENDILMGRGGNINQHSGNEKLRRLARKKYCYNYQTGSRKEKSQITSELLKRIRNTNPPGRYVHSEFLALVLLLVQVFLCPRPSESSSCCFHVSRPTALSQLMFDDMSFLRFLKQVNKDFSSDAPVQWEEVADEVARGKVSQVLRDEYYDLEEIDDDDDPVQNVAGSGTARKSTRNEKQGYDGSAMTRRRKVEVVLEEDKEGLLKRLMAAPLCQYYLPSIY